MEYVGIDLHESQICLLTETGEVMERRLVRTATKDRFHRGAGETQVPCGELDGASDRGSHHLLVPPHAQTITAIADIAPSRCFGRQVSDAREAHRPELGHEFVRKKRRRPGLTHLGGASRKRGDQRRLVRRPSRLGQHEAESDFARCGHGQHEPQRQAQGGLREVLADARCPSDWNGRLGRAARHGARVIPRAVLPGGAEALVFPPGGAPRGGVSSPGARGTR